MISNPATFFVNGSKTKSFTHEGGSRLFHFSPYDNKLSTTLENNLVFFANDEEHAADIFRRLIKFAIECGEKYIKSKEQGKKGIHDDDFVERAYKQNKRFIDYLEALAKGKIKFTEAPTNQFYEVGWASNDTIR